MIAIVDYGVGNLKSVQNMFRKVGAHSVITSDGDQISEAEKVLLPGVGHFAYAMGKLKDSGLIPLLEEAVFERDVPLLGICVGAQMLGKRSEEGDCEGLGWIDMECRRFSDDIGIRVPHMGWDSVSIEIESDYLFEGLHEENRFYFVHSYYMSCVKEDNVLAAAEYGVPFTSAVRQRNIGGVQFHPEKSHRFGLRLLGNFAAHA